MPGRSIIFYIHFLTIPLSLHSNKIVYAISEKIHKCVNRTYLHLTINNITLYIITINFYRNTNILIRGIKIKKLFVFIQN